MIAIPEKKTHYFTRLTRTFCPKRKVAKVVFRLARFRRFCTKGFTSCVTCLFKLV